MKIKANIFWPAACGDTLPEAALLQVRDKSREQQAKWREACMRTVQRTPDVLYRIGQVTTDWSCQILRGEAWIVFPVHLYIAIFR